MTSLDPKYTFRITERPGLALAEKTLLTDAAIIKLAQSIDATANPTREEIDHAKQKFYDSYNQTTSFAEKSINKKIERKMNKIDRKRERKKEKAEGKEKKPEPSRGMIDSSLLQLKKIQEILANPNLSALQRKETQKMYEECKKSIDEMLSMSDTIEFLENMQKDSDPEKEEAATEGATRGVEKTTESCSGCHLPAPQLDAMGKTLSKCSRCRIVSYCSAGCQRGNWKAHKLNCKAPTAGAAV